MTEFTRKKTFREDFVRIRLNERHLAALAKKIAKTFKADDDGIKISVKTIDGEDSFLSRDPEFFVSDGMPREIKEVGISSRHHKGSISCEITNGFTFYRGAEAMNSLTLMVEGTDPRVERLFLDLKSDLLSRKVFGERLLKFSETFWGHILFGILAGAAVLSALDMGLDLWSYIQPEFKGSALHNFLIGAGLGIVLVSMIFLPVWISSLIGRYLPTVEFSGRLANRKVKDQKKLLWLVILGAGSILANIFSELILDVVKLWLNLN